MATITNPVTAAVPTWAGGTLGAMANYGTSPGAVLVPGVNAFITNTAAVSGTVTANQGGAPWSENITQIGGVSILTGNGTTGSGSPRVTIVSDNTAFTVNAAQSGTWNVNNISGTVSLPTGASTTAKQPALGTAGTASADVITVQGIASMTKLLVTPDSVALPANQSVNEAQIAGTAPTLGDVNNAAAIAGVQNVSPVFRYNATLPTLTDTRYNLGQVGLRGSLQTNILDKDGTTGATVTAANALKVDNSAVTQPVSGTFWQATQPVSGTFWQATQPVSVASGQIVDGGDVTLGSKADAKSTATDTTAITIMQVLKEISAMVQAPASTPVTGTFWQATQPVSGTVTANQGTANATPWNDNVAQIAGTTTLTGNGTTGAGSQRVTIASDNTAFAVNSTLSAETTKVIGTVNQGTSPWVDNISQINGVTPLMGNGVTGTGSQRVTVASDNTPFPIKIDQTTPGSTNAVQAIAGTTGGASMYHVIPTASDNHAVIKNGAATGYSVHVTNKSATANYLRLYNAGTGFNGCNSATNVVFGMEIPPTDSGFSVQLGGTVGVAFATGLSICVTSGFGDTDTTNATATAIIVNVAYD